MSECWYQISKKKDQLFQIDKIKWSNKWTIKIFIFFTEFICDFSVNIWIFSELSYDLKNTAFENYNRETFRRITRKTLKCDYYYKYIS